MYINQLESTCKAWKILIEIASKYDEYITYQELSQKIGMSHHRPIRFVLHNIQEFCLEEQIPPLSILVVNKHNKKPGSGYIASDINSLNDTRLKVQQYDYENIENPFCMDTTDINKILDELINHPEKSEEISSKIKSRGSRQILFKSALLKVYKKECAITRISIPEALEAYHIIPWADASEGQKIDIRNGILLNNFHHRLFDSGLITISKDYRIKVNKKLYKDDMSDFERYLTVELEGQEINLPKSKDLRPLYNYIKQHDEIVGFEG